MARSAPQRTIHSDRAAWAWDRVSSLKKDEQGQQYATHARKLPARLLTCGLGQTMAFLFAKSEGDKKKGGAAKLLEHLGERILKTLDRPVTNDPSKIMTAIVGMDPEPYRQCTHELLAASEWLKRFAEGFFGKEDEVPDDAE